MRRAGVLPRAGPPDSLWKGGSVVEKGRVRLSAPARTPAGYGLMAAATVLSFGSPREALGVEYESPGCGQSMPWPSACENVRTKPLRGGPELVTGDPFEVLDSFYCFYRDDAQAVATARMALGAGAAVERALWTGEADNHPNFTDDAYVLTSVALELPDALQVLQQRIGLHSPAGGVIHMPRGAGGCLSCRCDVHRDGNVLRDVLGNAFALGSGYQLGGSVANTPLPTDAGFWAVATGPVTVRRGQIATAPATGVAFEPASNMATVIAEQTHVVTVECGMWAVPVKGCADLYLAGARQSGPPQEPQITFEGKRAGRHER